MSIHISKVILRDMALEDTFFTHRACDRTVVLLFHHLFFVSNLQCARMLMPEKNGTCSVWLGTSICYQVQCVDCVATEFQLDLIREK